MGWNWQKPDWPDFRWKAARFEAREGEFLRKSGVLAGTLRHLGGEQRAELTVTAVSSEAVTTSEIEGEILDRVSVQSSIRRQLGLAVDARRVRPAEQGVSEMMLDLFHTVPAALTNRAMFRWHEMLMRGRHDVEEVGRYRSGGDPMQVISGRLGEPEVHFEAPPAERVSKEMAAFLKWFGRTGPGGSEALPAITRAGMAHLYFVCVHPFEDGNGRIGRAVSEKALGQSAGKDSLTGIATAILARRKGYYVALEAANQSNEVTAWLDWFAEMTLAAQDATIARVEFTIEKTRLLDRVSGELNERQLKALMRVLREGPEGFAGGLSAGNYAVITGASAATATRDLADLVAKGALVRRGELRHARYFAAIGERL